MSDIDAAIESLRNAIKDALSEGGTGTGGGSPVSPGGSAGSPTTADDTAAARRKEQLEVEIAQAERALELSEQQTQTEERRSYQAQLKIDLDKKLLAQERERGRLTTEEYGQQLAILAEQQKQLEEKEKELGLEKEIAAVRKQSFKTGVDMMTKMGTTLTGYQQHPVFNVDNIIKLGKSFKDAAKKGIGPFMAGLATGIVAGFMNMVVSLIFQVDAFEKSIRKATDGTGQFARNATLAYANNRQFGVSMESNSAAAQALYAGMTDLTFATNSVQQSVIDSTAVMVQMGVSASDATATLQFFNKVANESPTGALESMREMESLARNLNVPVAELMSDFAQMSPALAKLGKDGERAFKELARVSKLTGLEINKLLALTDKFDTFEGAATMAGKLNAALGGNFVNAMDMMQATDPVERFDMLRGALEDAGLSFDNMSYYQRKFYAEQMGMSVSDLALAMSGDMGALGEEVQMTSGDYIDMANRAAEMATLQEKLQAIFSRFIPILTPLIDELNTWLDSLGGAEVLSAEIVPPLRELAGALMFTVEVIRDYVIPNWEFLIVVMGLKFMGLLGPLIAGIGRLAAALVGRLLPSMVSFFTTTSNAAKATSKGLPFILAWAAAIMMAGIGIGFAATGMAILIESMRHAVAIMPQILMYLGGLAAIGLAAIFVLAKLGAMFGFAGAMATAGSGPIMAIGVAVLLIGAAMLLGAFAFDVFATAVERVVNAEIVGMMAMFTIGVIGLAFAVLKLGLASKTLLPIFAALAAVGGIAAMIFGGDQPPTVDTSALEGMTETMNSVTPTNAEATATSAERLAAAVNGLNPLKAMAINGVLMSAIMWGEVTGANAIARMANTQAANNAQPSGNTNTNRSTQNAQTRETTTPLRVNVMLDRETLGTTVVELYGRYSGVVT